MNKILLFAIINFIIIENIWCEVRRDDQYPPPQLLAKWKPIHDVCVGRTGVSEDVIKRFSDGDEIFEDDKLKCYMDCLLQEKRFIMPDGKIDFVSLHESFNEDKEIHFTFIHMIRRCLYPAGEGCDRAYNMNVCFKKADPKHYFIV
ncbi:general odorant-binding protein 83a-like [Sitodiplosis mosellana]|uniref:general odorant-binding protein 83a-like n=1 Tax=Sitodiplosis mosellana TaxID=263140 RepID=UPI0024445B25|nr:general odorant-binding protein 83a-like [Sitodiplosis mosellana]